MNNRVEFQNVLTEVTPNVYFQPPSNISMKYPCIVYNRKSIDVLNANDAKYKKDFSYDVTVIDRNPDSEIASRLLEFKYCEFDRQYVSDGLNHFTFVIYY